MSSTSGIVVAGSNSAAVGTLDWSNPGNITADDGTRATAASMGQNVITHYLLGTHPDLAAIPSDAIIDGIVVGIEKRCTTASADVRDESIRLFKAGAAAGADRADQVTLWPATEAVVNAGGAADMWGTTWTPADVQASTFGVGVSVKNHHTVVATAGCDHIRITVYWHDAAAAGAHGGLLLGVG